MTPYHRHSWIHEERNADSARVLELNSGELP
jgi:hypothetical protein